MTVDNESFVMNDLPDTIDDMRFCVLDNSNPDNPDYFFMPLIFLESFNAPAAVLKISEHVVKMPIDWCMLIGDPEVGDLEVVPITSLNERGFQAFAFNPLSGFRPSFLPIEIINIYPEIKWYFPKLKPAQLLTVPLTDNKGSDCAFFIKEIGRQSEVLDIRKVW